MARAGRFRIGAMEALWSQLQFAPAAASQRMLSRIRSFMERVGPESLHSASSVVREIVRFPVEQVPGDAEAMFVGSALRADLAELHLRLSRRVPADAADGVGLAEAARRCGASVRTMRRWREHGLLLHWIGRGGTRPHVGVLRGDLDAFMRSNAGRIARAARFTQLSMRERESIRDAARVMQRSAGRERRAIAQIARAHGRSAGTVRALVVPVMERSRAAERRARESAARSARIWRCWRAGMPVGEIARHLGITDRVAQHALRGERTRRLAAAHARMVGDAHGLDPQLVTDTEWRIASSGLAVAPLPSTGAGWLAMRWQDGAPRPRAGTLAVVMRALLARAASVAAEASARPTRVSNSALDRAETDLRWAARILLTLAIDAMPALDARVRAWRASAAPADGTDPDIGQMALASVLEACAADISALRSGRTRIERLASAQMDLALARAGAQRAAEGGWGRRAMARAAPWCELAPLHDARAARLACAQRCQPAITPRGMLQLRYGWHGGAPHTIDEIARIAERPSWVVAGAIGRALSARGR